MKTVTRVQVAPNLAFHVPNDSLLARMVGAFDFELTSQLARMNGAPEPLRVGDCIQRVPLCNNPAHAFNPHTATVHAVAVGAALEWPGDDSECYVEPKP